MDAQEYNRWWNDFGRHIPPCDKLTNDKILDNFKRFGAVLKDEIESEYKEEIQKLKQELDALT